VVVFQNYSHQLPGFAQGPVETLDLVVLEEEGFELRQRLELLGQLLDLVVGEVDHLQVFGVQGELPLEVRQLVGVGEEPVEVGQVGEGLVEGLEAVAADVQALDLAGEGVLVHLGDEVAGEDQALQGEVLKDNVSLKVMRQPTLLL
jgi:hypothetical protein